MRIIIKSSRQPVTVKSFTQSSMHLRAIYSPYVSVISPQEW